MKARHFASSLGRFPQPDSFAFSSLTNPQSLNLYAGVYPEQSRRVLNNPLRYVDPTGHRWVGPPVSSRPCCQWLPYIVVEFGRALREESEEWMLREASRANSESEENTSTSQDTQQDAGATPPTTADAETTEKKADNRTGYDTPEEAARAALGEANPKSIKKNREYGGLIYRDSSGRYHYSKPKKGGTGGVNVLKAKVPKGSTVVGDYHTHGDYSVRGPNGKIIRTSDPNRDDFNSDHFSREVRTTIIQDARGRPGYRAYLGTPSGRFLVYDPATGREGVLP